VVESVWNLPQNQYDITQTLGMLLHYLRKLIILISANSQQVSKKLQTNSI